MNTGRGAHLPLEKNGPDSFFCYVRLATPPPQQARNFLALPVPIYTPGSREVMVKCLTQGHNMLAVTGL